MVGALWNARKWRAELDSGEVQSQAEIARRQGLTRARVCQIMSLLRLAPAIQEHILSMPDAAGRRPITERSLRLIVHLQGPQHQLRAFRELVQVCRSR